MAAVWQEHLFMSDRDCILRATAWVLVIHHDWRRWRLGLRIMTQAPPGRRDCECSKDHRHKGDPLASPDNTAPSWRLR
jgi:hypothetical protein